MSAPEPELAIVLPAFVAGLLVLATHVPLGQQVLARGIVFIDLAIAQLAALGVLLGHAFGMPAQGPAAQAAALLAALAGAALLAWTEKRLGARQEAFIGVLFVLAASVGVLLLAGNPHAGEHLRDVLVGQILWVDAVSLAALAAVAATVLVALRMRFAAAFGGAGFYVLFAVAITASVQVVGVYLVFASLIVPALATVSLAGGARLIAGYALGAAGYGLGLLASAMFDVPSGAAIVCALAAAASTFALLRRNVRG